MLNPGSFHSNNHNTPGFQYSVSGPFDQWPSGMGFDYFYGFNAGDTSQYEPLLTENRNPVPRRNDTSLRPTARRGNWV